MSWLRSWPSTNRFILVPPNPREEYQITRFHTTSGGFEQYPPTGRSPGQCGRNAGRRRRHPCLVHNSAVSGHDTDVRLRHRDVEPSKILHMRSPLPTREPILSVSGKSHRPLPDVEKHRIGLGIIIRLAKVTTAGGQSMMGDRKVQQDALFYEFSLERHVPEKHLLRAIDRFVELGGVRAYLAPFYSETGRPSIDPELLIRMLIVGYCFGIRSERRLCEEVHLNLAYRWFCRLGLDGDVPDHSTFSKTRHGRFRDADLLRELFETVVRRCMAEGLVGGEGFAVDASLIVADAHRQRGVETPDQLDPKAKRAVSEYLATLDDAAFGAATPVEPKFISPSDPAARWTASWAGPAIYAYCTNYVIDVEHVVIVEVEPSTAVRQAEVTAVEGPTSTITTCS